MQNQRGPMARDALFPRLPPESLPEFREYLRVPARRAAVAGAIALLVMLPAIQVLEIWILRPDDPVVIAHVLARAPVLLFSAVILLLWYIRPEGRWPRPLGLLYAVAVMAAITGRLARDMMVPEAPIEHASHPLLMVIAAMPIFAVRGVRDLIPIYGLPVAAFSIFLWSVELPSEVDTTFLVYPALTMLVGGFITHLLYIGHVRTFLAGRELQKRAMTDVLTGLLNRRAMDFELKAACSAADRHERPFALVTADIDHFKHVNDTHGHDVGDQVLVSLSSRMRDTLRTEDRVARWGGEEFLVLLHGQDEAGALSVAEKLRTAVAETPLQTSAGPLGITISLGVAVYNGAETIDDLLIRVDRALYQAKRDGRNRSSLATSGTMR